ncbi:MAG: alpha/beta hydrolase [Acidimicrobiaceae bacterium]|nr:alpha/beta hydrolase [Acidimicrobiaceae bacterium]
MSEEQKASLDATLRQRPFDLSGDLTALRAGFDEVMRHIPVADDVEKTRIDFGGVGALEISIRGTNSSRVILYFHGGVYVIGSADATVPLASDLARRFNAKVVSVDYRLAPEDPYPAALEDAKAAYEGLLSQGILPRNIAFAGESAGAGLAIALLLTLKSAAMSMPSSAFLMSPYADLTLSGKSIVDKRDLDPLFTEEVLRIRVSDYVARADRSNPLISPIYGDLSGLPPLLVQVGSHELLLSDAIRLAERAAEDDVAVILDVTPGVPHVFQGYAAFLDEGDAALNRAAEFLALHFSRPSN